MIIKRVVDWNQARYAQEYNSHLTESLLASEMDELVSANSRDHQVDQVDALCDIIYVAIGAMWKLGLCEAKIQACLEAVCTANETKAIVMTPSHLKANIDKGKGFVPPEAMLEEILRNVD